MFMQFIPGFQVSQTEKTKRPEPTRSGRAEAKVRLNAGG